MSRRTLRSVDLESPVSVDAPQERIAAPAEALLLRAHQHVAHPVRAKEIARLVVAHPPPVEAADLLLLACGIQRLVGLAPIDRVARDHGNEIREGVPGEN